MKAFNYILTFFFLLLFFVQLQAQQNKLDSLQKYLATNPIDTSKASTLTLIAKQYIALGDFDKAIASAEQAKILAQKTDFQRCLGNAINTVGVAQMNMGDYDKAMANYKAALIIREKINDQIGIAASNNNMGLIYMNGKGVPVSNSEAFSWYRKSADQGLPLAQHNLAVMYANVLGIKKNEAAAVRWYQKAAEQGIAIAKTN
mgnify:CR=1 FL=1